IDALWRGEPFGISTELICQLFVEAHDMWIRCWGRCALSDEFGGSACIVCTEVWQRHIRSVTTLAGLRTSSHAPRTSANVSKVNTRPPLRATWFSRIGLTTRLLAWSWLTTNTPVE